MKIDAWNIDVGTAAVSAEEFGQQILARVEESWADGADLVLLPEYSWMGAERFLQGEARGVADWFWQDFLPQHRTRLLSPGKAVVLGTVPVLTEDGEMRNRAPIFADGEEFFQDKLALTPWEDLMQGGKELRVWQFGGLRLAVLVCLDIEVPEWSVLLRDQAVDLILVPSATENLMGVERINRCASARAVELGCVVVVAHLLGMTESSLVDENRGCLSVYLPSQSATIELEREWRTEVHGGGNLRHRIELDEGLRCQLMSAKRETNPALLTRESLGGVRVC